MLDYLLILTSFLCYVFLLLAQINLYAELLLAHYSSLQDY